MDKSGNNEKLFSGSILICIPILNQHIIAEKVGVVFAGVLGSIGLDFLDEYEMHVDNVSNYLCVTPMNLEIPLASKRVTTLPRGRKEWHSLTRLI